jgi:hypothetical protein
VGVLRTYAPTNPGKRSLKYRPDLLSPEKDLGIDLDEIASHPDRQRSIRIMTANVLATNRDSTALIKLVSDNAPMFWYRWNPTNGGSQSWTCSKRIFLTHQVSAG